MAKSKSKRAESDQTDDLLRLKALLTGMYALHESLTAQLHGDGEHPAMVQEICRVATSISAIENQVRQYRKQQRRELAAFSLEQIVSYLKTLSESTRADLASELTGAEDEEPLL